MIGLIAALTISTACSNDDGLVGPEEQTKIYFGGYVPVEVQQENLKKIFSDPVIATSLLGKQTRSTGNFSNVKAFSQTGRLLTRAEETEAYYYLFDLDEQGNYALMGANITVPPLLAIITKDKDISQEMRNLIATQEPALANFPESITGVTVGVPDSATNEDSLVKIYDYANAQFQLLGRTPLTNKWNQWEPFQNMMPSFINANGVMVQHAAVGCAPLAAALIMCDPIYRTKIKPYKGLTFNWGKMIQYETMKIEETDPYFSDVATYDFPKLFETLTSPENDNFHISEYGEYCSWTDGGNIRTFLNFGLSNAGSQQFDSITVIQALKDGYPIFMSGYSSAADPTKRGGHAWVCSAALLAKVASTTIPKSQLGQAIPESAIWKTEEKVLLHHNFGWSGNCNGYYYIDIRINTEKNSVLNDNLQPNYRAPKEWWGDFKNDDINIIINK